MGTDWREVPMPLPLADRPHDERGYPITFVTLIDSQGKADFTTIDGQAIVRCINERLCGLCGTSLRGEVAFIGGPLACENKNFLDPPMHVECATYAMQVCPHIATPTARYKKPNLGGPEQRQLFEGVHPDRPDRFGLFVTDDFQVVAYQGQPVFLTNEPLRLEWND